MLRAQRRLLRRGGRIATLVIEIPPGLGASDRRRASAAGPVGVATASTYPSLLRSAGLAEVEQIDQTREYRTTAAAWLRERQRQEQALREVIGGDRYEEHITNGTNAIAAIDDGLLGRTLYIARRT